MRSEGGQPELLGYQSHRGTEGLVLHLLLRVCVGALNCLREERLCRVRGGGLLLDLVRVFRERGRRHMHTPPAYGHAVRMRAGEGDPSS